ncbi:MAG: hypothetical protein ACFFCS_14985 [Candidatus Hodarchaeota archaeon]
MSLIPEDDDLPIVPEVPKKSKDPKKSKKSKDKNIDKKNTSLIPEDDDLFSNTESLLPPEDQEDVPMFVDGDSGPDNYEQKRKSAIPKYKNLMPKKVFAMQIGAAAVVLDLALAFVIYIHLRDTYDFHLLDVLPRLFSADFFNELMFWISQFKIFDYIFIGLLAIFMLALLILWGKASGKVSSCPVCGKKNSKNYHVCSKCDYIFMSRDIINREIISVRFNNLDYTPEQIRGEFLERKLADLTADYIKAILIKNHFL